MAVYCKDIPDDTIDASLEIKRATDKCSWVMIERQKFAVHEFRAALATVHEYIDDGRVSFCTIHIHYRRPIDIEIFVCSRDNTIYVSIGYRELSKGQTEMFKIVTLTLSEFLSIAKFVLDTLS